MKIHRYANIGGFFAFWAGIISPSLLPIFGPVFLICAAVSVITPEPETTEQNQE